MKSFVVAFLGFSPIFTFGQLSTTNLKLDDGEAMVSAHLYLNKDLLVLTGFIGNNTQMGMADFEYSKFRVRRINDKSEVVWKSDIACKYSTATPKRLGGLVYNDDSEYSYFVTELINDGRCKIYQINNTSGVLKELDFSTSEFIKDAKPTLMYDLMFGAFVTKQGFYFLRKENEGGCYFTGFAHDKPKEVSSVSLKLPVIREYVSQDYVNKKNKTMCTWELFDYHKGTAYFYTKTDRLTYHIAEVNATSGEINKSYSFTVDLLEKNFPAWESLPDKYPFLSNGYINGFPKYTPMYDDFQRGEKLVFDKKNNKILISGSMNSSKKQKNDNLVPTGYYAIVVSEGKVEKSLVALAKEFKKLYYSRGGFASAYLKSNGDIALHVHDWYNNALFVEKEGKLVFELEKSVLHGPADAYFKAVIANSGVKDKIDTGNNSSDYVSFRKFIYYCTLPTTYYFMGEKTEVLVEYKKNELIVTR